MRSNFNPLKSGPVVTSILAAAKDAVRWLYDPAADPVDPETGKHATNGQDALVIETSIGIGRGSAIFRVTGSELPSLVRAMGRFDPNAEQSEESTVSPAEMFARTVQVETETEGEGDDVKVTGRFVTFKLSNAKNARTIRIPVDDWSGFSGWLDETVKPSVKVAVDGYRKVVAEESAREAERIAKGEPPKGKPGPKPKNQNQTETPAAK